MGGKQYRFQDIGSHIALIPAPVFFAILVFIVWPCIPEKVGINET
jgi:hypothetical protein